MSPRPWVIGSRASALAQKQSRITQQLLSAHGHTVAPALSLWTTEGDRTLGPLWEHKSGKGLFVREIQEALLSGTLDIAVHSLKDLSVEKHPDLRIAGIISQAPCWDLILYRSPVRSLFELHPGARIGTSSLRRCLQLHQLRPDCHFVALRGNVGTRLQQLDSGRCDAIVLAAAGLERLGITHQNAQRLGFAQMVPAFNQGLIGLECRAAETKLCSSLTALTPQPLWERFHWERTIAKLFYASCRSAIGILAEPLKNGAVELHIFAAQSPEKRRLFQEQFFAIDKALRAVHQTFELDKQDWSQCHFAFTSPIAKS